MNLNGDVTKWRILLSTCTFKYTCSYSVTSSIRRKPELLRSCIRTFIAIVLKSSCIQSMTCFSLYEASLDLVILDIFWVFLLSHYQRYCEMLFSSCCCPSLGSFVRLRYWNYDCIRVLSCIITVRQCMSNYKHMFSGRTEAKPIEPSGFNR